MWCCCHPGVAIVRDLMILEQRYKQLLTATLSHPTRDTTRSTHTVQTFAKDYVLVLNVVVGFFWSVVTMVGVVVTVESHQNWFY